MKSAGKRQESATFLQRSFLNVAMRFFACCSAVFGKNDVHTETNVAVKTSAAQLSENCSAIFFCLWHVAGRGLEGWGLGLADSA